jgi:hypothetical protein
MFHVKHFKLLLLCLLPFIGYSQAYFKLTDQPFLFDCPVDTSIQQWVSREVKKAKGLSAEETSFFYWVNFVRQHPTAFSHHVLMPFLEQFPETKGIEANTLINDLSVPTSRPLLHFSTQLQPTSLDQALDLVGNNGQLSHYSKKGLSFSQRMKIAGIVGCASENLYTGKNDPVLALLMLLLDLGLDPPGHRLNILNPVYLSMAVSIRANKHDSTVVLVQTFGCK